MLTVAILDGYVDEPTCLGVPPYISPYPRYIAGAVWNYDHTARVVYRTIDQLRAERSILEVFARSDLVVVIAGMAVPGRYLSGFPASPNELLAFLDGLEKPVKVLCGPAARYGFGLAGGKPVRDTRFVATVFDLIAQGDGEIVVAELLRNKLDVDAVDPALCRLNAGMIRDAAIKGARVVEQHSLFPHYLITEIETYRGCPRSIHGGCSFCSEPSKGPPDFRPVSDILSEIAALYSTGIRHFRLGNQPCIFSYMAIGAGEVEFPEPNPDALERLFHGIRAVAPELKTLHIDNANPGVLARYPRECRRIAKSIIRYHTPGDVAALGVESVDPVVIARSNLKADAEEVLSAVKLLNEVGSARGANGLPELLPGLNFVFGLDGESKDTFQQDYQFLQRIMDEGLLLRRINLRQVIPIPGTKQFELGDKLVKRHKHEFRRLKHYVRTEIDRPMLKRIVPESTVLTDVYLEIREGTVTFGRQLGSYPLLVGIPGVLSLHRFLDVKVIGYGYRSITAVPYPLAVNTASLETLMALPGVGAKRATRIAARRPFRNSGEFVQALDDPELGQKLLEYITVK
jgi:radical SAM superfamily enzyme with C-terminal helix-hairpin-helix motif